MNTFLKTLLITVLVEFITTGVEAQAPDLIAPTHSNEWYSHHIMAVDEDGNALRPIITISGALESRHYTAYYKKLEGEETRGARVDSSALKRAVAAHMQTNPPPFSKGMEIALRGRQPEPDKPDTETRCCSHRLSQGTH